MSEPNRANQEITAPIEGASGLDCEQAIHRLLQCVEAHIADEPSNSMLRTYLERELGGRDGSEPDSRLAVHAQINVLRELFGRREDHDSMALLEQIERECC